MDLESLYGASFVDWEAVAASWAKRTISSRLLLLSARRYLSSDPDEKKAERAQMIEPATLPDEIKAAFASPPENVSSLWGGFVDAALATELEMIPYGERPILLSELRAGLGKAAEEAGADTPLGRWFLDRRNTLPGEDLPENPEYLPV